MFQIDFHSEKLFYELDFLHQDEELKRLILICIQEQKKIGMERLKSHFKSNPNALREVSEDALNQILAGGKEISDIRTNTEISNCLVFHADLFQGSVIDQKILSLRKKADQAVTERLFKIFRFPAESLFLKLWKVLIRDHPVQVNVSGHFWYPPGGFMGWHTNLRKPGWRMYINYAEESGKSFFRYRDPDTKKIVTCMDQEWNFRLFKITLEKPFWHAVYSDTNRFSLGYAIINQ